MNVTFTGTTTLSQSGPGSNGNEGVLHTSQIFRTRTLPLDSVLCYIQDHYGDTVSIF